MKLDWRNSLLQIFLTNFLSAPHEDLRCLVKYANFVKIQQIAPVVSKMGILAQTSNDQNCIKLTNKIPEYARDYKNEWLFIRGINKEFGYFVDNIDEARYGLFENTRVDTIKNYIKKFLLFQERGKLKDTSNFEISNFDVEKLIKIDHIFCNFNQYIIFTKCCFYEEDEEFICPYLGFENIYDDFLLFFSKFKIKYEEGIRYWDYGEYSDSDSDGYELPINGDIEDDDYVLKDLQSIDEYDFVIDFDNIPPPIIDSDSDSDSYIYSDSDIDSDDLENIFK